MITVHASRTSPSFDKAASEDSLSLAEGSDNTEGLLRPEVPSTFLDEPCDFDAFLNLSREVSGKREVSGAREVAGESSEVLRGSIGKMAFAAFTCSPDGVRFRRCRNAARDAGGVAGVADAASDAAVRSIRPEPTVPGAGGRAGAGISFAAL